MYKFEDRLSKIEKLICEKPFRENKGLGNEVGYYIFDYTPEKEIQVRDHLAFLENKINRSQLGFKIIEFDLYKMMIDILDERGYLEKCFEFEKEKGIHFMNEAIVKLLRLTSDSNLLVNKISQDTTADCIVFLTGIGKSYPIIRSHNVLNNLHQVLDTVPVVMFYPGVYTGQSLDLFGTVKDDNYYRAFKLV